MPTIKNLDLNLLKALDALLDERNVTRAAEKLSVSQPAMSGMLTRLRESFGDPLFIRTQHGILPTDRAQSLTIPVKQILEQAQSLLAKPDFDPARAELDIALSCSDYAMHTVVAPFYATLRRHAPNIRLQATLFNERTVQEDLERGALDFILTTSPNTPDGLHQHNLFDEHYVCALRRDHPQLQNGTPDLAAFCRLEHALVTPEHKSCDGAIDQALHALGAHRRIGVSVQSFLVLPELLRGSDLCAVVPYRLIARQPDIQHFMPPVALTGFSQTLAWHDRTHRNPAHQWLRDLITASCQSI